MKGKHLQIWQLMVLAVVQGLTEFLPISSTAHLAVIPRLFHWQDPGLAFDVALHVGTLLAVLIYFAPTWNKVVRAALQGKRRDDADAIAAHERSADRRLGWFVIVATIPAMISGILLQRAAETSLRTLPVMGAMLIIVGILMWLAERLGSVNRKLSSMTLHDSLAVGIAQAFAVIPGVSRSGSTIAAGLYRGMDRDSATRFSFLLSTPDYRRRRGRRRAPLVEDGDPAGNAAAACFRHFLVWSYRLPLDLGNDPLRSRAVLDGVRCLSCDRRHGSFVDLVRGPGLALRFGLMQPCIRWKTNGRPSGSQQGTDNEE